MNRNKIMQFFRNEDLDEYLHTLSDEDKYEIAFACLGHSEYLTTKLEESIKYYTEEEWKEER